MLPTTQLACGRELRITAAPAGLQCSRGSRAQLAARAGAAPRSRVPVQGAVEGDVHSRLLCVPEHSGRVFGAAWGLEPLWCEQGGRAARSPVPVQRLPSSRVATNTVLGHASTVGESVFLHRAPLGTLLQPSMVVGEPSPPAAPGGGSNNEYFLQCGVAIRTIREEIPRLFEHDITYDIYRDDITFLDNITTLPGGMHTVTHGKESYRKVMWSVRFHGKLFFSRLQVNILRIWQPRDKTISVRWSITGDPRVLHSLGASEVFLDGVSEYKLDSEGMIYEHKIESVDWNANHTTLRALNMFPALSAQTPTPSFFAEP